MTPRRRAGFTLVELLVVVAIIAVLAAMLAPVYKGAKDAAKRGQCQSNLEQLNRAFSLYMDNYSGCYPRMAVADDNPQGQFFWSGYYWREPIRKYIAATRDAGRNMILSCPSDPTPVGIYAGTSYAYSACFFMTPEQVNAVANCDYIRSSRFVPGTTPILPRSTIKSSAVRFASKKVLVAEYWTLHSENPKVGWYDDPVQTGNDPWSGARNYLFADGHVVYLPTARIHAADSPVVSRPRSLPDINLTRDGVAGKDID